MKRVSSHPQLSLIHIIKVVLFENLILIFFEYLLVILHKYFIFRQAPESHSIKQRTSCFLRYCLKTKIPQQKIKLL